jgi:hypothetical protein
VKGQVSHMDVDQTSSDYRMGINLVFLPRYAIFPLSDFHAGKQQIEFQGSNRR